GVTSPRGARARAIAERWGSSSGQYLHQVAQNTSNTTLPRCSRSVCRTPWRSSRLKSGAGRPVKSSKRNCPEGGAPPGTTGEIDPGEELGERGPSASRGPRAAIRPAPSTAATSSSRKHRVGNGITSSRERRYKYDCLSRREITQPVREPGLRRSRRAETDC